MREFLLYMKPGCHLCYEAAMLLERLRGQYGFAIREVDITLDPSLQAEYDEIIPVVEMEGRLILAAPFGEATARKVITRVMKQNP
ncbi:MAG TPA: glutaredoxin family protein [Dehalococcoidia bacterium]|nr:glutaredoxin family protein [Dehalococcoidia bacterium]